MPSFAQDGTTYEYLKPTGFKSPEDVQSGEYGKYPKVLAAAPLADGGTADVYGESTRWSPTHISVSWVDHKGHTHSAWVPKENVRRATDSEWDSDQYRRCPEDLRVVRWGERLPGIPAGRLRGMQPLRDRAEFVKWDVFESQDPMEQLPSAPEEEVLQ